MEVKRVDVGFSRLPMMVCRGCLVEFLRPPPFSDEFGDLSMMKVKSSGTQLAKREVGSKKKLEGGRRSELGRHGIFAAG